MDFEFSEEEVRFRESVQEFCKRYIEPRWVEIDEGGKIPLELIKKMGEQGLFMIPVSEEYGGMGGTITMAAIAIEEIAYHDPSVAVAVYALLNNGWPFIMEKYSLEDVKREILPKVARGEAFYGIASTESQGGSDVAGIKTLAIKKGDKWIINGEKTYISGVREIQELPQGGGYFLVAKTGKVEYGHRNITAFNLILKWDGKVREGWKPTLFEEIGRRGISTGAFTLEDFELEDKYRIGEENKGFYYLMEGFNVARILVAAATIGSGRWAIDQAIEWIRNRRLFEGRPISSFQGVSFRFSELYGELEAAKLLTYRAAWLADKIYIERDRKWREQDLNVPVALCKMKAPEATGKIYEELMKWYGAYAYTKDCNAFRGWIGTLSYLVGAEGAQNIMRIIIARDIIGREYVKG
ncbi:MAG: acyl-CoA/acyl-ACP dehydrogenase [Aigarchaeota archaeon]|nr:acyl-CoA/acyl-ACP dehydrogenase [Aigarchaeota archaeon]